MNKALRLIFWGYPFIFFRIQIGIDLLADPIGYYLIYSGGRLMTKHFHVAKKVEIVSFIGMLISLPGVFVNLSEAIDVGWMSYTQGLFVWKVIVVYYLLGTWKSAIQGQGYTLLRDRLKQVYLLYMGVHFAMTLYMAFSFNIGGGSWSSVFLTLSFSVIAMDIALLVLIAALSKVDWKDPMEIKSSR